MVTNRCNLKCSYCVLEDSPNQLRAELDLNSKKELVSHLYNKLGFRRLTLSGGEVLIIGKHPPKDFIELLQHISTFRSEDPKNNLEIEIYTNGTFLDENLVYEMQGVVDSVAVTIDSTKDNFLSQIGRNFGRYKNYYENIMKSCSLLSKANIELKFHSVISTKNHLILPNEVKFILDSLENIGGKLSCWKFYQYMSYDSPEKDKSHAISNKLYEQFKQSTEQSLHGCNTRLHFKDNQEMNASLFNILSYGNAQYMRDNDSWSTSKRTEDLRSYNSISDLFARHDINEERFRHFHEIKQ
jgi:sulfatase maturation enzyme AslB (radical SAM superfamily)